MDLAALQHSVFLQALGSAILNSLWQCFILWLVYETITASYKSASARFKNNLGTLLLFFSFAWFLTSFISKIFNQQNITSVATMPKGFISQPQHGVHAISGFSTFLSYASASLPYLSVAYIFLLFFLIAKLFAAYRYVYFISNKRLINPTVELQLFAGKVAREIGITKKISVWISHHIDVPATIGFIKPVILIPLASINNLSCHQLEAIILHELAHIKRNDYITNLIIAVIETILFFNPFVVLLSNVIKRERENCCDDFVLQYRYDPHSYASALLRLEQSRMSKLKLAIGAVSGKKQLLSRIKRITSSQVASRQFNYGQKVIALLLVTAFICSIAWLSPGEKKPLPTKALAKDIKRVPLSKPKSTGKANPAEAIVAGKQNENIPAIGMKHVSPKNEPVTLLQTDIENPPQNNSSGEDDDDNKNNQDFFKVENNAQYSDPINLKQPSFYLDANNLKLPSLVNIQNFLRQNMNLNIDLGKIDMAKLNEACKQINAVDWNKVQNEIRRSFANVKPGNLSKKDQDALLFYGEKAKALTEINIRHILQQYNSKVLLEKMKKEVSLQDSKMKKEAFLQDSLCTGEAMFWNNNHIKIRQAHKKLQGQCESAGNNYHYYYNYSNSTPVYSNDAPVAVNEEEATVACPQRNSARSDSWKKTIRISIRRSTPDKIRDLNEKKPLQFSFGTDDDEKSNHEKVISVEVND